MKTLEPKTSDKVGTFLKFLKKNGLTFVKFLISLSGLRKKSISQKKSKFSEDFKSGFTFSVT